MVVKAPFTSQQWENAFGSGRCLSVASFPIQGEPIGNDSVCYVELCIRLRGQSDEPGGIVYDEK